jgi:Arylsulfotransferase (ASST)
MHVRRRPLAAFIGLMMAGCGMLAPAAAQVVEAASASVTCSPVVGTATAHAPLTSYTPITPDRVIDTRDGTGGVAKPLGAGCTLRFDLSGAAVPGTAEAVALSVTAIAAERNFLTVFPCVEGRPPTSNLNTRAGIPTPNLVISAIGTDRRVCVFANARVDLVIDVSGYFSDGPDRFASITPVRAYDTREVGSKAPLAANTVLPVHVGGAQVPAAATSAVVNLTVTGGAGPGFLVAYECGTPPPLASNLNFIAGEPRSVAAIVGLSSGGDLCVLTSIAVHVVIDVTGWYGPAPGFGPAAELTAITGRRVADTRTPAAPWSTPFAARQVRSFQPLAGTAYAGTASAVVLNVVATNTGAAGYVALYPCTASVPLVSSLNFAGGGGETTNLVTVELSASDQVCVYASQPTDLVIDLFGVYAPPAGSLAERLSFTGRDGFPDYSPTGTDYAVGCNAAPTTLMLHADVLPGVSMRVNGILTPPGDIAISTPRDGLVTLELRRGATVQRHYFRCVPPDFPRPKITRTGDAAPGWYLTTFGMGSGTSGSFVAILDQRGAPVWFKRTDVDVIDLKRLSNGSLMFTPLLGNAFGVNPARGYRVIDVAGNLLTEYLSDDPATYPVDHHDAVPLPNGGRALLSYPLMTGQDLRALGADFFQNDSIVDGVIREMDGNGAKIWSWSTHDNFDLSEVRFPVRFGLYPGQPHGGEVDLYHLNSLDSVLDGSNPADTPYDYVVSSRHLDAVFRVDRETDAIDWILGGDPTVVRAERLTIKGDPLGGPRRPHDARLNGDVLTLFDNRTGIPGQAARAVAYRIDETARTATLLWQITEPQGRPSNGLGSVRVASDGSVLVAWGGLQPMFEEFDASHHRLWTFALAPEEQSYRIVKYPTSAFNVNVLRGAAGGTATAPT